MTRLREIAGRIRLSAGFYAGMLLLTAVSVCFVAWPGYMWLRHVRKLPPDTCIRHLLWHYGRAWTKLFTFFVPVSLTGCDRDLPRPCIVVPNHQSFFDAYCIGFLLLPDVLYAVRAWPFRIPVYGPFMRRAGYMNAEHTNSMELLRQGTRLLKRGASIVIFPEGTRSPDGRMQRFHAGAFHLALAADVPIVPLCIDGTGAFLPKGDILLRRARISITALPPVDPKDFAVYGDEAPLRLRQAVKTLLNETLRHREEQPDMTVPVSVPS